MFRHAGILALSALVALGSGCTAAPHTAATAPNTLSSSTASAPISIPESAVPGSSAINPISTAASPSVAESAAKAVTQASLPILPTLPVAVPSSTPPAAPSSTPPAAPISVADSERPIITSVSISDNASDNAVVQGSAVVTVGVSDNTALSKVVINFKKNGVVVVGGNHIVNVSGKSDEVSVALPAGLAQYTAYTVSIGAQDEAGNTASTVNRTFTVDNTPPSTSYSSPNYGQVIGNNDVVRIGYNDDVLVATAHVFVVGQQFNKTYSINNKQGDFSIPVSDLQLPDGTYTIRTVLTDTAGNESVTSDRPLVIDNTIPTVDITSLKDGSIIRGTVPLSITATDQNLVAFSYRIRKVNADGSNTADAAIIEKAPSSTTGVNNQEVFSWDTTKLGDGRYYVYVSGRDAAGNRAEKRIFVTVDGTKPTVALTSPAGSVIKGGTPIVLSAADNNALDRVVANIYKAGTTGVYKATQLGANGAATLTDTVSTAGLPEGQYYVKFNATDLAGNLSATTTYNFTIDNTAPTITVKPESKGLNGVFSEVSFKLFDAHQVDKAVINGVVKDLTDNVWSDVNYVRPGVFGGKEGRNTITVYDVAGNTATYDFVLDTTGPEITVKPGSTDSLVSFKLHDAGSAVDKVTINGVEKNLTDNAWSDLNNVKPGVFGAVEGSNILVAYDVLGNTSTYNFTLN